jgi:hypothetical protein
MFFRGSRYEHVADAELIARDGRLIRYKRMRFIPEASGTLSYIVRQGDRPDLAAYNTLGDPELFWRLCDVNRVQRAADLTSEPGGRIQVPGPDGG